MATIPSLAMIPSGYKATKLYSVLPTDGVGDFTVARASTATRVNSAGLIETMAANVPRLDYSDGGCPVLLTEPQSTNGVLWSEDFTQSWSLSNSTIDSNAVISPDGSLTADKLVVNSTNANHSSQSNNITGIASSYTAQCFFKKGELGFGGIRLMTNSTADRYSVLIDLNNGTFASESITGTPLNKSYEIKAFTGGWYRLSITMDNVSGNVSETIFSSDVSTPTYSGSLAVFQGDNTSGIYIWGAQLEEQSYPTSYIKTEATTITRVGDVVTGAGDVNTFNSTEGVLCWKGSFTTYDMGHLKLTSTSVGTNYSGMTEISNGNIRFLIRPNAGSLLSITQSVALNTEYEIAIMWQTNNKVEVFLNGVSIGSNVVTDTFVENSLEVLNFSDYLGNNPFVGKTKEIKVYKSIAEAQADLPYIV